MEKKSDTSKSQQAQSGDTGKMDTQAVGRWLKQKYLGEKNDIRTNEGVSDARLKARIPVETRYGDHVGLIQKENGGRKMSKKAYAIGFVKAALAKGVNPEQLAKYAWSLRNREPAVGGAAGAEAKPGKRFDWGKVRSAIDTSTPVVEAVAGLNTNGMGRVGSSAVSGARTALPFLQAMGSRAHAGSAPGKTPAPPKGVAPGAATTPTSPVYKPPFPIVPRF